MVATQNITSLESVLDLAVTLEKQGQAFYERARDAATDPGLKGTFDVLVAEEKKHCAIYRDLYELYTGQTVEESSLLGDSDKYIQLLVNEITQALAFEGVLTQEDLVSRALRFEKNTLLCFAEIKPLFRGKAGALIEAICREEKRHIQLLFDCRDLLRGGA